MPEDPVVAQLSVIARLLAASFEPELPLGERVQRLAVLGLTPNDIAAALGTSAGSVRALRSQKARGAKARRGVDRG